MKNQEPKEAATTSDSPAVVDQRPRIVSQKVNFPQPDYLEPGYETWPRPTQLELANLAARLARTEKIDAKQLVAEAWELYVESCRKIEADHVTVGKLVEELDAQDDLLLLEETGGLPQPEKYPVTFPKMELLLLPKLKGRTRVRASVFREYALAQILEQSFTFKGGFRVLSYWDFQPEALRELREEHRELVATRFGSWRKMSYDAPAYVKFAVAFLKWYARWTKQRHSNLKAANARKGWEKRKAVKRGKSNARPKWNELKPILKTELKKKLAEGA